MPTLGRLLTIFSLLEAVIICSGMTEFRKCDIPYCKLPSREIPGGLSRVETPQMVVVIFDGRLGEAAEKMIRRVFDPEKKNPNECPIVSTFYVSNENTNYCSVNRLWAEGHEMGVNGVTRHSQLWWQEADSVLWNEEVKAQLENLDEDGGISKYDAEGWRTPYLQPGGDTQYYTINLDHEFFYDSTLRLPLSKKSQEEGEYWPFTLDRPFSGANGTFRCDWSPCPVKSHPGIWELPIPQLFDPEANRSCTYLDGCLTLVKKPEDTYHVLHYNFDRHYSSNRSPFLINVRPHWLVNTEEALTGLANFVDDMVSKDDVWLVTGSQAIRWTQQPKTLGELDSFRPWGCINKRYLPDCKTISTIRNSTVNLFPGLVSAGGELVKWQYIALLVAFIIIVRIDKVKTK